MSLTIYCTAALTLFSNSISYITYLFSEWRIRCDAWDFSGSDLLLYCVRSNNFTDQSVWKELYGQIASCDTAIGRAFNRNCYQEVSISRAISHMVTNAHLKFWTQSSVKCVEYRLGQMFALVL